MKLFHILYISFIFIFSTPLFSNQTPKLHEGFSYYGLNLSSDLFFNPILYNDDSDFDEDGVNDKDDWDDDNDGIPDFAEMDLTNCSDNVGLNEQGVYFIKLDVNCNKPNHVPYNGICYVVKFMYCNEAAYIDTDEDGKPNSMDLDSDNDGIPDAIEGYIPEVYKYSNNQNIPRYITDVVYSRKYNKFKIQDICKTSPSATTCNDSNRNGWEDHAEEYWIFRWYRPTLPDGAELKIRLPKTENKANYKNIDSDNDGLLDAIEAGIFDYDTLLSGDYYDATKKRFKITPENDENKNGWIDAIETAGIDFNNLLHTDSDNLPNYVDKDDDGDGTHTKDERPDPNNDGNPDDAQNSDGRAAPDYLDGKSYKKPNKYNVYNWDLDNDGIPDYYEMDIETCSNTQDGDKIPVIVPILKFNNPCETKGSYINIADNCFELNVKYCKKLKTGNNQSYDRNNLDSDGDGIYDAIESGIDDITLSYSRNGKFETSCFDPDNCKDKNDNGWADVVEKYWMEDITQEYNEITLQNSDGDAKPDFQDIDDDGDGVHTIYELTEDGGLLDTDGDSIKNYLDKDDDGDGILTRNEHADDNNDGNPSDAKDSDSDSIPDYLDPDNTSSNPDTDKDGAPDFKEDVDGTDEEDGCSFKFQSQIIEPSDDWKNADCDNDGIKNKFEKKLDSDEDGLANALDPDDDGDGVPTKYECLKYDQGTCSSPTNGDPQNARDTDRDSTPDYLDIDDDGDGINTDDESPAPNGDLSNALDSDNDTVPDYLDDDDDDDDTVPTKYEINLDTDGDGIPDYLDIDDDNDGILTKFECVFDTDTKKCKRNLDRDTIPDYLDDDRDNDNIPDQDDWDDDNDGIPDFAEIKNLSNCKDNNNNNNSVTVRIITLKYLGDDCSGCGHCIENRCYEKITKYCNYNGIGEILPDRLNLDSDNDGIYDIFESGYQGSIKNGEFNLGDCNLSTNDDCNDKNKNGWHDAAESYWIAPLNNLSNGDSLTEPLKNNLPDTDDDANPDFQDPDDDDDGVLTENENPDPNGDGNPDDAKDTDGDGIKDYLDNDANETIDSDGDGIPDQEDFDDDNDGIPDYLEVHDCEDNETSDYTIKVYFKTLENNWKPKYCKSPGLNSDDDKFPDRLDTDSDNDGLYDLVEAGGNDNDHDGIIDGFQDANKNGIHDSLEDNPLPIPDTDGDNIPNFQDNDDDGDGIYTEHEAGEDVNNPTDTDKDGTPDYLDDDDDGDSILTKGECLTENEAGETEIEKCPDLEGGIPKNPRDTDKDGTPDYLDDDDDGDGILTKDEDQNKNGKPEDDFNYDQKIPDYRIYNKKTITGNSVFSCSYSNNKNSIFYILIFLFTMLLFKQYRRKEK